MEQEAERIRNLPYFTGHERRHENGALSFVMYDDTPWSPAEMENLSTVVQLSSRHIDLDSDDEGLVGAWNHFDVYDETQVRGRYAAPEFLLRRWEHAANSRYTRLDMMQRYLRIFRPEIHAFEEWYHAEGGRGIVYVSEDRRQMMGTPVERCDEVMRAEMRQWQDYFSGSVVGVVALIPEGDIVVTDVDGETVLGTFFTEESCWGYYPDHEAGYPKEYDYACAEVAGSQVAGEE